MKKTVLILALVFALALPSAAMAAAEFSLGGYIKLEAFWDSTQESSGMGTLLLRNNNLGSAAGGAFHHGRLRFTSHSSRFNFTIKGPKLWGATTTGFIEMDFSAVADAATTTSNSYAPRLRHAMFRLNWPGTELMFGQYWSMFSQWFVETTQDGPFQITGTPTARMPQIRLTQKFAGAWQVAALIGESNAATDNRSYSGLDRAGAEAAEAPQIQAQIQYSQDLWGKAAWYGKPTPFTAQVTAGWQRNVFADAARGLLATGQDNYTGVAGITRQQYLNPWMVMGSLFVPIIPTHSANLAGTASLQTSWWIGQGVEAFGFVGFGSQVYRFQGVDGAGLNVYDTELMNRFGGQVQLQYYFTNQWFLTGAWGFSRAFGMGAYEFDALAPGNRSTAFENDTALYHNEFDLCLWFRPITALKFGLQYNYNRTNWLQTATDAAGNHPTSIGDAHRVTFVGLFFF